MFVFYHKKWNILRREVQMGRRIRERNTGKNYPNSFYVFTKLSKINWPEMHLITLSGHACDS